MPAYLQRFVDHSPSYSIAGMSVGPDLEIKPELDLEIVEIPDTTQNESMVKLLLFNNSNIQSFDLHIRNRRNGLQVNVLT